MKEKCLLDHHRQQEEVKPGIIYEMHWSTKITYWSILPA